MTLPKITGKQIQILTLLYKYRYLNRVQIQTMLKHKNHRRIHAWLNDLVSKEYIGRIYSKKLLENTKPAVYYLGKNGRKKLAHNYDKTQLQNTYRDKQRTEVYRQQRMYLAEYYLSLKRQVEENYGKIIDFTTSADETYRNNVFLKNFGPDARVLFKDGKFHDENEIMIFLLHERTPKYYLRYRLKHIVNFICNYENEYEKSGNPYIQIICTKNRIRSYAKKILESKLYEEAGESAFENFYISLATLPDFINKGYYEQIWQEPEVADPYWG